MHESICLFQAVSANRYLKNVPIFLFLNKKDLFDIKIRTKPINKCFPLYDGPNDGSDEDRDQALKYIADVFLSVANGMGGRRQIYPHITAIVDSKNVERLFYDLQYMVLAHALQYNGMMDLN